MNNFKKICLILLTSLSMGCSTVKWEWFPQESSIDKDKSYSLQSKWDKEEKEAGTMRVNVLKASF
tara:strand:+ start:372 stop:566 length:195 start_codon:yes stop_codon:yes gene_type:complete